jgi:hypothetical protein
MWRMGCEWRDREQEPEPRARQAEVHEDQEHRQGEHDIGNEAHRQHAERDGVALPVADLVQPVGEGHADREGDDDRGRRDDQAVGEEEPEVAGDKGRAEVLEGEVAQQQEIGMRPEDRGAVQRGREQHDGRRERDDQPDQQAEMDRDTRPRLRVRAAIIPAPPSGGRA